MAKFPYTNFHELNLDWVLQVVYEFKTKYAGINTEIDQAVETISNAASQAETQVNDNLELALSTLADAVTAATTRINNMADELPASAQDILGRLALLDNIITGYVPESFVWLQGSYVHGAGVIEPTPPAIDTEALLSNH